MPYGLGGRFTSTRVSDSSGKPCSLLELRSSGEVHHGEAVGGEGILAGERGQQHLVAGLQAAAVPQRGRDGDVGAGGQGDHAAGVAARGHHARVDGQRKPVTALPAQRVDDGPVGDPPG
jgi:hypothetical protein